MAGSSAALPLGPYPDLNGFTTTLISIGKTSLIGAGDASRLFPQISPSSPSPAPGGNSGTGNPLSVGSTVALQKSPLSAQVAGFVALAVAILLMVARLSLRKRPGRRGPDSSG
ncbi:MAG: hypothetical protein JO132_04270 [Streptosporangiaceae bacterium]|nr:hypothetical protein [Streptosporangiaceae bacterium]